MVGNEDGGLGHQSIRFHEDYAGKYIGLSHWSAIIGVINSEQSQDSSTFPEDSLLVNEPQALILFLESRKTG